MDAQSTVEQSYRNREYNVSAYKARNRRASEIEEAREQRLARDELAGGGVSLLETARDRLSRRRACSRPGTACSKTSQAREACRLQRQRTNYATNGDVRREG